ncbi:hypothetical protein C488_05182 [Natrinema pellirubrum DSM 15624]|uniref:Uncharacterized protein n=1 Tax=Natrinema pellirubrum (strain DSM 15624 / CIP 106293 / JCM 10476 / NCIMB 786 / 157) TaxID=797303 RepID=L9YYY4_NATP1|nr:hypothetical protein C488_05182 [Natrinema pellirubrum DSM 15624]
MGVETASDEDALVGIEKEPISLVKEDGSRKCIWNDWSVECVYEYTDVELIRIIDNTPSSKLEVTDTGLDISAEAAGYPSLEEYDIQMNNGKYIVKVTLRCDAGFNLWDGRYQESSSTDLTMDLETSDGTITVELEREIPVQCE